MFSSGCHVEFHAVFYLKKKTTYKGVGGGEGGRGGKEGVTGTSGSPQVVAF